MRSRISAYSKSCVSRRYDNSTAAPAISPAPSLSMAAISAHGNVSSIPKSRPIFLTGSDIVPSMKKGFTGEPRSFAGTAPEPMQTRPMQRSYESWYSSALGRKMEFLWFGWSGYPVLAFPTSMGRFFQYEDTGLVGALASKIEAGYLQLVCADSVDAESWYDEFIPPELRGVRHEQYDAYLAQELVPYVRERSRFAQMGTFGCSFGAYHAANFAGRHPEVVSKAVCL